MTRHLHPFFLSLLLGLIVSGCSSRKFQWQAASTTHVNDTTHTGSNKGSTTTYCNDIKPLLQQRCDSCHSSATRTAGVSLDSYGLAVGKWDRVLARVASKTIPMPPSGPIPSSEIEILNRWAKEGYPECTSNSDSNNSASNNGGANNGGSTNGGSKEGGSNTNGSNNGGSTNGGGLADTNTSCNPTGAAVAAPVRVWRLSHVQYNNTVRDLLGDTSQPANAFELQNSGIDFSNGSAGFHVSDRLSEQYQMAAETLAAKAIQDLPRLLPCVPADPDNETCVKNFITEFGKKTFRQPLTIEQQALYFQKYLLGKTQSPTVGVQVVVEAMLQSPYFLYRLERGGPEAPAQGIITLTSYEMASQLSYLLWNSMPDPILMTAADQGKLSTVEEVKTQAERMLLDPKAKDLFWTFFFEWFDFKQIATLSKDQKLFPEYNGLMKKYVVEEAKAFINYVVWEGSGTLKEVLTAQYSFLNEPLAKLYGVSGPRGTAFQKTAHKTNQRAGIFTTAAFLSLQAGDVEGSPVHRGVFIREKFLGQPIGDPPPDVTDTLPPKGTANICTNRERYFEHSNNQRCMGCHSLIDGMGFTLENYDAIGKYRDLDNGCKVDASGEIVGATDPKTNGALNGALDLARVLADSNQVSDSFVRTFFHYAMGRNDGAFDQCHLGKIKQQFRDSGGNFKALLLGIVTSDVFFKRKK